MLSYHDLVNPARLIHDLDLQKNILDVHSLFFIYDRFSLNVGGSNRSFL